LNIVAAVAIVERQKIHAGADLRFDPAFHGHVLGVVQRTAHIVSADVIVTAVKTEGEAVRHFGTVGNPVAVRIAGLVIRVTFPFIAEAVAVAVRVAAAFHIVIDAVTVGVQVVRGAVAVRIAVALVQIRDAVAVAVTGKGPAGIVPGVDAARARIDVRGVDVGRILDD